MARVNWSGGAVDMEPESLSDSELYSALRAHGISIPVMDSTRSYLRSKLRKLQQASPASDESNTENETFHPKEEEDSQQTDKSCEEAKPFEGYFGVAGTSSPQVGPPLSPYYTSRSDALRAIKGIPGARFKKFETPEKAEEFSAKELLPPSEETDDAGKITPSEKANNLPSLKPPEISEFGKTIEKGDVNGFLEAVWSNPTYLINIRHSDTPEIIKQGPLYNALMIGVKERQIVICRHLLDIIQSAEFWTLVYPADSDEMRVKRKDHLLDLYLNLQDRYNLDTPLHFACKFGYEELVRFLLSFPATSRSITNIDGNTPAKVICTRVPNASAATSDKIAQLLQNPEVCYVSVLRSMDNCTPPQLCRPCTVGQGEEEEERGEGEGVGVGGSSPVIQHALAGPMSPAQAGSFYREWRSPRLSRERRGDPERGLERVGRRLAHQAGVGWTEYWDFLGVSCDLSTPDGHLALESYLSNLTTACGGESQRVSSDETTTTRHDIARDALARNLSVELFSEFCSVEEGIKCTGDVVHPVSGQSERKGFKSPSSMQQCDCVDGNSTELSFLTDTLSGLAISGSKPDAGQTGLNGEETRLTRAEGAGGPPPPPPPPPGLDTALEDAQGKLDKKDDSFGLSSPPSTALEQRQQNFLTGGVPSKLDYDVLQALCGSEVQRSLCPLLHDWLQTVTAFSEQEQKTWRTPKKSRVGATPVVQTPGSLPLSPLVTHTSGSPFHHSGGTTPLRSSRTTPLRQSSATPLRSSGTTPLRQSSATPLRSSGTTPLRQSSVTPLRLSSATPLRLNATPLRKAPVRHGTPLNYPSLRNK